jgi:hypothetical protein
MGTICITCSESLFNGYGICNYSPAVLNRCQGNRPVGPVVGTQAADREGNVGECRRKQPRCWQNALFRTYAAIARTSTLELLIRFAWILVFLFLRSIFCSPRCLLLSTELQYADPQDVLSEW